MDYTKPRRIVRMTPNKLAVYFVADIFVADMVLADIDFPCGRYGFCCGRYHLAVADMVVADVVCGRYGRTPFLSYAAGYEGIRVS